MTCWLWHKWGKWTVIEHGLLFAKNNQVGIYKNMEKYCERCGIVKLKCEQAI